MNTDKLMELERKWRELAKQKDANSNHVETNTAIMNLRSDARMLERCADELAAPRAVQIACPDGISGCLVHHARPLTKNEYRAAIDAARGGE